MGRVIRTILVVVVAVAIIVFAPQIAPIIGQALSAVGIAATTAGIITTLTAIGISLALSAVSSLLFAPKIKMPDAGYQRLQKQVQPAGPRKIVFGRTAAGADVRFYETYGSKKDQYSEVIALASHKLNAIKSITFENDLAWQNGALTGALTGINSIRAVAEGTTSNGQAVGTGAYWNSTATFTGCAYLALNYSLSSEKWPKGIPQRITTVVEGCPLYDPRRDSTNGGSGPHRIANQSTWAFTDGAVEIGRNPALAMGVYLIGYRINGKLVWGMGVPPSRINWANIASYANVCEEAVQLQGGGTVQRYLCDGIASTADTHENVINSISSAMGSCRLLDVGGQYGFVGGYDETLGPKQSLGIDDIVSPPGTPTPYQWNPAPSLRESFNIVRGRFADPAQLYQYVDWGEVSTAPLADGIPRNLNLDLAFVSRSETCQRIAKQFLLREKLCPGLFSAAFGPRAFACVVGSLVTLSVPAMGWSNKLFRVVEQAEAHDLIFQMTLREESADIYAWDREEKPLPENIVPTGYNPRDTITPQSVTASSTTEAGVASYSISQIALNWTAETSGRVAGAQIESKPASSSVWTEQAALASAAAGSFRFASNVPGAQLDIRIRFRMTSGVYSPWVSVSATAAPASVTYANVANTPTSLTQINASEGATLTLVGQNIGNIANIGSWTNATMIARDQAQANAIAAAQSALASLQSRDAASLFANAAANSTTLSASHAANSLTFANIALGYATAANSHVTNAAVYSNLSAQYRGDSQGFANAAAASASAANGSAVSASNSAVLAIDARDLTVTYRNQAQANASASAASATQAGQHSSNAAVYSNLSAQFRADSQNFANASAASASASSGSATSASNAAASAITARDLTVSYRDQALANASASAASAAVASGHASAANTSATVAASIVPLTSNRNPMFSLWANSALIADGWTQYNAATVTKVTPGLNAVGNALKTTMSVSGGEGGFYQQIDNFVPGFYVVDATVKLDSGALTAAGIYGFTRQNTTATGEALLLNFATAKDQLGTVRGVGTVGQIYRFTALKKFVAACNNIQLYAMHQTSAFGNGSPGSLTWYSLALRPATQAEIDGSQALTETAALTANVTTQSSAIASLQGRTGAFWVTEANTGGSNTARISMRAETSPGSVTSDVELAAKRISLLNPSATSTGGWSPALEVVGGEVRIAGSMVAGFIRNASNSVTWNVSTGVHSIVYGSYRKMTGAGFGANSDLMEWWGANSIGVGAETKTNGIWALATDGKPYFPTQAPVDSTGTPISGGGSGISLVKQGIVTINIPSSSAGEQTFVYDTKSLTAGKRIKLSLFLSNPMWGGTGSLATSNLRIYVGATVIYQTTVSINENSLLDYDLPTSSVSFEVPTTGTHNVVITSARGGTAGSNATYDLTYLIEAV